MKRRPMSSSENRANFRSGTGHHPFNSGPTAPMRGGIRL